MKQIGEAIGFYPTYEELKLPFDRNNYAMLVGFYPTYEELKHGFGEAGRWKC